MGFKRLKSLVLRFKGEIITMTIIGLLLSLLFSSFFPGEETMKSMLKLIYESALAGLFNSINMDAPGWILWITLILGLSLNYILAFSGINIGAKVIPTVEADGIDTVITNSSYSIRKVYLWNYLSGILSIVIITIPLYIMVLIFSLIHHSSSMLDELALSFLICLGLGIFYLTITSVSSILRFSKSFGKIIGFGYLIFSFLIDLMGSSPQYADYVNLSISHYLNPTRIIFKMPTDTFWDIWRSFFVVLAISLGIFLVGLWRVKYPDYIERVKELNPNGSKSWFHPIEATLGSESWLGKKFPIFTNQLWGNMKTVIILLFIITLHQFALFSALPDVGELVAQLEQSNTPIFAAFAQNHVLPSTLLGFIILKFYDALWIYFGIAIALIAAKIPNKDVRSNTHDIIFGNDISPIRLILARTLAMILSFTIFIWVQFFIIRGIQSTAPDFELSFMVQAQVFTVLWVHYIGLGILLMGIAMIPLVSKGKNLAVFVFIFFILMAFIPFLNPDIEFLKYSSYLNYYDPIGLLLGEVAFSKALLISSLMLVGSSVFTYLMIRFKYSKTDLR
ncbi:MAG: hypothetical protein ACTSVU_03590 [Promethearchaeota archaeon]